MRLARICISATALAMSALVVSAGGAAAASPCPPGQPPGRMPGGPANQPGQPPGRPPQYPPGKCQLQLSAASVAPRGSITAAGDGYAAGSSVALRLGATDVGPARAGSDGRFSQAFTVPPDEAPGQYEVRATGVGLGGSPYEQTATLEVLPVQAQPQTGGRPLVLGYLRSGAGLAAAPQPGGGLSGGRVGNGSSSGTGGTGIAPGVVPGPGGLTVLPGGLAGPSRQPGLVGNGAVAPEHAVDGAPTGPSSSGGFNPVFAVAGGVLLAGAGAGIVVAARRRSSPKP